MDNILFYLISSFLFLAIIKESMGIFFVKKEVPCFWSFFVWIAFCIIEIIGTTYITIPIFRLLFDIVCGLVFCMILYTGSLKKKLIWILIINLMGMLTETIVGYIFIFMGISFNQIQILGSFVSKIILLMILTGLKIFNHSRLKRDIPFTYWCVLFFIPLGSIFILNTLFSLCELSKDKNISVSALLSSAIILVINFIIIYIYEKLSDRLEIQKQQIIFNKQIELCKNQIYEREESTINIRNIKHDIENHLICIRECIERKDCNYAKKYIDDLVKGEIYFKTGSCIDSGNIVVDALLNYKNSIMQQLNIKMITRIEIPYNFKFNDADICVILGNCIDNSIEAVNKIENKDERTINVEIIYRKNSLLLKISNPYLGNTKKDNQGNFVTTKFDAENHGIGLNSVKKAVQKYNGLVNIVSKNKVFIVQILLYS